MQIGAIILVVLILIGALCLTFFSIFNKITYLDNKTRYALDLIKEDLDNKYNILSKTNELMKKTLHAKKNYLQDINSFNELDLNLEEKDIKLTEYADTVDKLLNDYSKLSSNKNIKLKIKDLREIDEKIDASKTYFNKYTTELSKIVTKFPNSLIAKIARARVKPLFQTNEMIKKIEEES